MNGKGLVEWEFDSKEIFTFPSSKVEYSLAVKNPDGCQKFSRLLSSESWKIIVEMHGSSSGNPTTNMVVSRGKTFFLTVHSILMHL